VENIPQKVFYKDTNLVYISCNANYAQDLRIKPIEIVGKTDYDFYPKEMAEKYRADDIRIIESGKMESIEEDYIQDGQKRVVQTFKVPVRNEGKNVIGVLGVFQDITERKQAEEALHMSEKRLQSYIDVAEEIGWVTNADGLVLEDIPSFRKFTGQSYEEVKGSGWSNAIHPDDKERTLQTWSKAVQEKTGYEIEYRLRRYDGEFRDFLARAMPVFKEDGSIREWIGTCIDITERKKANEELKFRAKLLDSATDSITVFDSKGRLVYFNEAARNSRGYTTEAMTGKRLRELVSPEYFISVSSQVDKMLEEQGVAVFETADLCKDGSTIPVEVHTRILKTNDEEYFISVSHDIKERKRNEQQLKESYSRLAKTLDGVTKSIAVTVELRDPYTAGHQERVARLAEAIAKEMDLSNERVNQVYIASLLHDIGKISIPAEILSHSGKLSDIQFSLIRKHPEAGYDILKNIDFPYPLARWVLEHHERIDGTGYPSGLKGDKIHLEAKIIAVADVVEAMSSHRPYRPAIGIDKALEEIRRNKNVLYDEQAVDACLSLFMGKGFKFE